MKNYRFTPEKQEAFLALIRLGTRPLAAASSLDLAANTVKNYARSTPDFAEAMELAHHAAAEPIEEKIYEAALDGDPWAVKLWLTAYNPEVWGAQTQKVEISGEISHIVGEGSPMSDIIELQQRALQRSDDRALGTASEEEEEILDIEILEPEPTPEPEPEPEPELCAGITKAGTQCKRNAVTTLCPQHQKQADAELQLPSQCAGSTKAGTQCRRQAGAGETLCPQHKKLADQ
tara:strand:- start:107 stop:805 length:699 start_codon:yes stop_codon:yes gene_type:complete